MEFTRRICELWTALNCLRIKDSFNMFGRLFKETVGVFVGAASTQLLIPRDLRPLSSASPTSGRLPPHQTIFWDQFSNFSL